MNECVRITQTQDMQQVEKPHLDELLQRQQGVLKYLAERADLSPEEKQRHYDTAMEWIRNDQANQRSF